MNILAINSRFRQKTAKILCKIIVIDIDFTAISGYTESVNNDNKEAVPMKVFWKLLVAIGVLAAAGAAVMLWLRQRKKRNICWEEDCCSWDDVCDECNGECDCTEE